MSKQTTGIILTENPDLLILGGPPTYLEGMKVDKVAISSAMENAARIAGGRFRHFFSIIICYVMRTGGIRCETSIRGR